MEVTHKLYPESGRTIEAFVCEAVLAHDECDLCGEKQYDKIIAVESSANDVFSVGLCANCATWLLAVLPSLVAELGSK